MARRMALFASRFLASSRSDSLRGTALAIHTSRTPAIEHCSALRTYAAKAASPRTRKKSLVGPAALRSFGTHQKQNLLAESIAPIAMSFARPYGLVD